MPKIPKSARFFGFQCKFENLAEAKRKLKNLYPDGASVVFLSSRPNQTGIKEIHCKKFLREIRQNPPKKGLRLKKPGKHIPIERPALVQKGRGNGVVYNEWFSKKRPNFSAEVNVSEFEKKTGNRDFLSFEILDNLIVYLLVCISFCLILIAAATFSTAIV